MNRSDYISVEDARIKLGVARGTMHYYLRTLNIQTEKFPLDRRAYIKITDFETIQRLRQEARKTAEEDASAALACSVA
jgi:hypothetical protein